MITMATDAPHALILLCICLPYWIAGSHAEDICPLDTNDCSQFGVPCTIIRDPGCSKAAGWARSDKLYPAPVTELSVSPYYLPAPTTEVSISRVLVTWPLPGNDTSKYLTGFEVRLVKEGNLEPYCFIFNISGSDVPQENQQVFKPVLNCTEVHNGGYTINVTSLPNDPTTDMVGSAMLSVLHKARQKDGDECRDSFEGVCWDTDLVVYNRPCRPTPQIRVVFTQASEPFNIASYIVALMEQDGMDSKQKVEVARVPGQQFLEGTLDTSSLSLPLLQKHIAVRPSECYNNNCRLSNSMSFDVHEATKSECTFDVAPVEGLKPEVIAAIIVGCVVGTGLLTAIIVIAARICSSKTGPKRRLIEVPSPSPSPSPSIVNMPRYATPWGGVTRLTPVKSIYLLYSHDCASHMDVMGNFAAFLRSKNCLVLFDVLCAEEAGSEILQNKTAWIRHSMEMCDHILLVNSEGTYRKAVDSCYSPATGDTSILGDMFRPGLNFVRRNPEFMRKVVMCYFDYTDQRYAILPDEALSGRVNYRLLEHMENLLNNVGLCGEDAVFNTDLPVRMSSEGCALANAIERASVLVTSSMQQVDLPQYSLAPLVKPIMPQNIITDGSSVGELVFETNQEQPDSGYQTYRSALGHRTASHRPANYQNNMNQPHTHQPNIYQTNMQRLPVHNFATNSFNFHNPNIMSTC